MKNVAVVLVMCLLFLSLFGCNINKNKVIGNDDSFYFDQVMNVDTPYCRICIPMSFDGKVKCEVSNNDPYTLKFTTVNDNTYLFSLIFNGKTDNLIGTLMLENENIIIYADFAQIDENNKKYSEYSVYQEGINTIIKNLVSDYNFVINQAINKNDEQTFDIDVSFATLKYPVKWKESVKIDNKGNVISFSCDNIELFELCFEKCDGVLLGTYGETEIYLISHETDTDGLDEDTKTKLSAMQEDVNVIIRNLKEDPNFKVNR